MKKNRISYAIGIALLSLAMGCSQEPADKETEVIVVPVVPGVVAPIVTEEKPETETKSTKVRLDENGVKVETEKVDVEIKK